MSLLTKNRKRVELVWPRNPMAIYLAIAFIILLAASIAYLRHSDLKGNRVSAPSQEIVTKRTATTKTFLNNDGTLTSRFYGQPVHYQAANGRWQTIDTDFVKKGDRYILNKASYNTSIPKIADDWSSFSVKGHKISFRLSGDGSLKRTVPKVARNKAIYKNVYKNTDLERIATPTGLKQNLVLSKPGHPTTFKESLKTALTPKLQKYGSVNFYKGNKLITAIPKPFLTDAKGKIVYLNYEIATGQQADPRNDGEGGSNKSLSPLTSHLLSLRLPSLKGLVYPITVDPSFTNNYTNSTTIAGALSKFSSTWPPTTTYAYPGGTLYLGAWRQGSAGSYQYGMYRSYLMFQGTSGIPDTASVVSSNLVLYPRWQAGITKSVWDINIGYANNTATNPTWGPALAAADWGAGSTTFSWGQTDINWPQGAASAIPVSRAVPLASVNKIGNTEYEVVSSLESGPAPVDFRYLVLDVSAPYLEVTYSTGANAPTMNSIDNPIEDQLAANFTDNSNEENDFHFYVSTSPTATSESNERYTSNSSETTGTGARKQVLMSTDLNRALFLPNTRYYIRSRAHVHSTDSYSPYSNEISKVTVPREPAGLSAVAGWDATNGYKNTLSWRETDLVNPATRYRVYYFTSGSTSWAQVGGEAITGTSFTHAGLQPGKTYYYRVFSVNSAGEENPKYTFGSVLSSGGVVNALADSDWSAQEGYHIHLSWQGSDILNPSPKYHVYLSSNTGSGWSNWTQIGGETITTPFYTVSGISPNTLYAFKIYGVNSADTESAEYSYAKIKVDPVVGGSAVSLSATQDTTVYQNYPTLTSGTQPKLVTRNFDGISRVLLKFNMTGFVPAGSTITGATLGLYYYGCDIDPNCDTNPANALLNVYRLTSTNTWQESTATWSNIGSGGTWATTNPAGAATNLPNGFNIPPAWTNFDVTEIVQNALNSNNGLVNLIVKLQNEGVTVNPINFYSKEGGSGFVTNQGRPLLTINYVDVNAPPAAPNLSGLTANSSTQISANLIDQSSSEDDFHIYSGSATAPTIDSAQVSSVSTNAIGRTYSKTFTSLLPNTRYYLRTKAHNHNNGLYSAYSNELNKATLANIPIGLRGEKIAIDRIQVTWDANANPAGTTYELYYANSGAVVYSGANTTFSHTITNPTTTNRINTYKVRAINADAVATDWTELVEVKMVSPHANYTQDPDQCAICHRSHTSTMSRLINSGTGIVFQADFCYTCHDGTGSVFDVKSAVDSNASHHPIKDSYYMNTATYPDGSGHVKANHVLDCTQCHDPHGTKKPDGTSYAKLLRSKDAANNVYYEGNAFCGACHGANSTLIGGDHLTLFEDIPHNTMTVNPPSGTKIKCLNCHGNNNSSGLEGTAPHGSDNPRITKQAEENLCYQCHNSTTTSENGINIEELFSYALSVFTNADSWLTSRHNLAASEQADGDPNTAGNQPSKVECNNCHNPHKNSRGDKKMANPDNTYNLFSQKRNDPKLWNYQTNTGLAVLMPFYKQRAQDIPNGSGRIISFQGPQAPADGQDTYVDSSQPNTSLDPTATLPANYPDGIEVSASTNLVVGKSSAGDLRSFILFTDINKIPVDSTVTKAYLAWPTSATVPLDTTKPPISFYRVTSPWQETVTWNSKPMYDSTAVLASNRGAIVTYSGTSYLAFDITSLVQGWVRLTYDNFGLMMMSPEAEAQGSAYSASFASSELQVSTNFLAVARDMKPSLVIEYTTPDPPKVADVNSFCLSCHDGDPPSGVSLPNISRARLSGTSQNALNVSSFAKTDSTGDVHGGQPSTQGPDISGSWEGSMVGSYRYGMGAIQCTDCHEPHGENNVFHFKKNINWVYQNSAKDVTTVDFGWQRICLSCHIFSHVPINQSCAFCHFHGAKADIDTTTNF